MVPGSQLRLVRRISALIRVGRLVEGYVDRPASDRYAAEVRRLGFEAMTDLIYGADPLTLAVAMSRRVRIGNATYCRYGAGTLSAARQRVVMVLAP